MIALRIAFECVVRSFIVVSSLNHDPSIAVVSPVLKWGLRQAVPMAMRDLPHDSSDHKENPESELYHRLLSCLHSHNLPGNGFGCACALISQER